MKTPLFSVPVSAVLIIASLFATVAKGDAYPSLISNFNEDLADDGADYFEWTGVLYAMRFTTGDSASIVYAASIWAGNFSGGPVRYTAYLYTDAGGVPGTALVAGLPGEVANESLGPTDLSFGGGQLLGAFTSYWFVLGNDTAGEDLLAATGTTGGYESDAGWELGAHLHSLDGGETWRESSDHLIFSLQGEATAVPEPASWATGAGFAALGATLVWRRRRRS